MLLDVYRQRIEKGNPENLWSEAGLKSLTPLARQQGKDAYLFDLLTRGAISKPESVATIFGVETKIPPKELHPVHPDPEVHTQNGLHAALAVDRTLREAGYSFQSKGSVLDFGAGAGRVVRFLAPAYPNIDWHACDVVENLVAWGEQHLSAIRFSLNPVYPPSQYKTDQFDTIFAVSVFSHLTEEHALLWLKELHRILKPGGYLLITVLGKYNVDLRRDPEKLGGKHGMNDVDFDKVANDLEQHGFVYVDACKRSRILHPILADPPYGAAFMLPKWIEMNDLNGRYEITLFKERALSAQDGIVLRKRA